MSGGGARPIILDAHRVERARRPVAARHRKERLFQIFCLCVAASSVVLLALFLGAIVYRGVGTLSLKFLTNPPDNDPAEAGLYPAIFGSLWLLVLTAVFTLPLGVGTAIILEEFAPRRGWARRGWAFIQTNISNLSGVPSVVYGIVGLTAFVSMFQLFGNELNPAVEVGVRYYDQFFNEADRSLIVPVEGAAAPETVPRPGMAATTASGEVVELHVIPDDAAWPEDPALAARTVRESEYPGRIGDRAWYYVRLPFGRGVLAGALTLTLVILPVVVIASQEALRAVPRSLRDAALGLGATRWQAVWRVTLPAAVPGIMTGAILAMGRAIGEAAPLLMIAGIVFISNPPRNLMDDFTAMPLQIYNWAQRPQGEFHDVAASGIIVLLVVLLVFNAAAVFVRQRLQRPIG
jgi:phosphate transport system permease protein